MTDLMTQAEAARRLGVSKQRVHQLVHQLGLGQPVAGGGRLLSEADLQVLKARTPGKPGRPRNECR
jgi:excisionase family DNA binding protein